MPSTASIVGGELYPAKVLRDGAIGHWRLGEASGLAFADATGNGHTASIAAATGLTYGVAGALADGNETGSKAEKFYWPKRIFNYALALSNC